MYTNINFLKERIRLQELEVVRDKRIALMTSVVLVVFLIVVVSITLYQIFLSAQVSKVDTAYTQEQAQLRSLEPVRKTYVGLVTSIDTVQNLVAKRGKKWEMITFLYNHLPPGSSISAVDLRAGTDNILEFSVQSQTVFTYEQLSNFLQSSEVKAAGYNFTLGTLNRGRDGIYRLDISVDISKVK